MPWATKTRLQLDQIQKTFIPVYLLKPCLYFFQDYTHKLNQISQEGIFLSTRQMLPLRLMAPQFTHSKMLSSVFSATFSGQICLSLAAASQLMCWMIYKWHPVKRCLGENSKKNHQYVFPVFWGGGFVSCRLSHIPIHLIWRSPDQGDLFVLLKRIFSRGVGDMKQHQQIWLNKA